MKKIALLLLCLCVTYYTVNAQKSKSKAKKTDDQEQTTDSSDESSDDGETVSTKKTAAKKGKATDDGETASPKKASKKKEVDGDAIDDEPTDSKSVGGLKRVEIEAKFSSDNINLIPVGDEGMILFYESDERSKDGQKKWNFVKYNTNFKEVATGEYMADKNVTFIKAYYDKVRKLVYILLTNTVSTGMATGSTKQMEIVRYNIKKNTFSSITGTVPAPTTITDMYATQSTVYFGGFTNPTKNELFGRLCLTYLTCGIYYCAVGGNSAIKFHPMLFYGDFKEKKIGLIPIAVTDNKGYISNISRGTDSSNVSVSISRQALKNDPFKQTVKIMGQGGKEGREYEINSKAGIGLNAVAVSALKDKSILAVGSYTKFNDSGKKGVTRKSLQHSRISDGLQTTGFYISKLVGGKQQFIRCYPFTNFFKNNDSKFNPKTAKGAAKLFITREDVIFHDPIETEEGIVMIGEFFYDHYHTETYYDGKTWHTVQVFDGYVFTNALVACFDPANGDMLWNSVFDINFYTPPYGLYPHTTVMSDEGNGKMVIVYNDGTNLKSKVLNNGKLSNGNFSVKLETGKETDKVVATSRSSIEYWYDNYFIAYGYESIKTKGKLLGGRRQVFYFNKIEYIK